MSHQLGCDCEGWDFCTHESGCCRERQTSPAWPRQHVSSLQWAELLIVAVQDGPFSARTESIWMRAGWPLQARQIYAALG